ncbi:MAG: hypothetical protein ACI9C1_000999 [Candidatus Aldehydirespiratoraceae bacterium]|jgi:hypothetical protein
MQSPRSATAFVLTRPVAYQCLWALGFKTTDGRVLFHSRFGCAFYGAFATKTLVLHSKKMPGWALPGAGASLVVLLTAIWATSSLCSSPPSANRHPFHRSPITEMSTP